MRTFKLTWHYRLVIVPIIMVAATIASVKSIVEINYAFSERDFGVILGQIEMIGLPIVTAIMWYAVLVIPYKIAIRSDGRLGFRSLIKQKIILATQIKRIENNYFTSKIHYSDGKIYLTNLMNEFGSIAGAIKHLNPKIEIKNNT